MIQLIYSSAAVRPFAVRELDALLAKSRQNNQRLGVTGMLLHFKGRFLQVLEGNERVVRSLYDRICQDKRHDQIRLLVTLGAQERRFANWSMGFYDGDLTNGRHPDGFVDVFGDGAKTAEINPGMATRLILSFQQEGLQEASR